MNNLRFRYNCIGTPSNKLEELHHIIDNNRSITYSTFKKHISRNDLNYLIDSLGYSKNKKQGLTFVNDWHISFHKSKTIKGKTVYYFCHSAIEYIFY